MLPDEDGFRFGHDRVQALVMRLIRHGGDFANPIGDASCMNSPGRAQLSKATVVVACAVADPVAATIETGERNKEEIGLDGLCGLERLRNRHGADAGGLARSPEAEGPRRTAVGAAPTGGWGTRGGRRRQ